MKNKLSTSPSSAESTWVQEYYTPDQPGAFSGATSFQRHTSQKNSPQLRQWLRGQDSYTLHAPIRRRFQRRPIVVHAPYELWQADLSDVSRLRKHNKGYRFLLAVIDVFSKVAFVRPLKSKTGPALVAAFTDILRHSAQPPHYLQTDKGTEFTNKHMRQLLQRHHIHFYTSQNEDTKAAVVERFQRTLKGRMYRYFTHHNTKRYIDVLQALVDSYNATYHRSIRTQPRLVGPHNQDQVYMALYGKAMERAFQTPRPQPKFSIGDRVRLAQARRAFQKGYVPKWTQELFTIHRRLKTHPYVYTIRDDRGELIKGTFYEPELQKVHDTGVYKIEKVLRRRGRQVLVKWLGYSDEFNSWIPVATIRKRYKN
ncbi:hypothetical protein BaRGS_00038828 [Batillaria attramentaria]|uniref:Integrase catalytic domain-containing protein n=1 Tax=Batillaria attramentaria TaxID=370345 RepID=A0ABD0J4Q2_9CAEN